MFVGFMRRIFLWSEVVVTLSITALRSWPYSQAFWKKEGSTLRLGSMVLLSTTTLPSRPYSPAVWRTSQAFVSTVVDADNIVMASEGLCIPVVMLSSHPNCFISRTASTRCSPTQLTVCRSRTSPVVIPLSR